MFKYKKGDIIIFMLDDQRYEGIVEYAYTSVNLCTVISDNKRFTISPKMVVESSLEVDNPNVMFVRGTSRIDLSRAGSK